ncbi:MAG: PqiC family protein [Nitrosospira sp.]
MKLLVRSMAGMVALLLAAGCASVPETRFYTLSVSSGASEVKDISGHSRQAGSRPIFIDVMPVSVPARLARPQLVVRRQGPGQDTHIFILERDRWSSNFNYELRDAFTTGIANQIGAINETNGSRATDQPGYRIAVELSQFDAIVGDKVRARFGWTVTRSTDGRSVACYATISEPVSGGIEGVVKGIQRVVSSVAADISKNLSDLDTGHAAICAPRKNVIERY